MGVGGLAMVTVAVRGRCLFVRVSRRLPSWLVDKTAKRSLEATHRPSGVRRRAVPIGLSRLVSPRDSLLSSAGRTWAHSLETPRSHPRLRDLPASLVLVPRLSPSRWRRYHWCSTLQLGQSRRSVPGQPQL